MVAGVATGPIFDIGDPLKDICKRLGLDPAQVGELEIKPRSVVATIYLLDEDGSKYIEDNGLPATEVQVFRVKT